jgi:hypothetical protein
MKILKRKGNRRTQKIFIPGIQTAKQGLDYGAALGLEKI